MLTPGGLGILDGGDVLGDSAVLNPMTNVQGGGNQNGVPETNTRGDVRLDVHQRIIDGPVLEMVFDNLEKLEREFLESISKWLKALQHIIFINFHSNLR